MAIASRHNPFMGPSLVISKMQFLGNAALTWLGDLDNLTGPLAACSGSDASGSIVWLTALISLSGPLGLPGHASEVRAVFKQALSALLPLSRGAGGAWPSSGSRLSKGTVAFEQSAVFYSVVCMCNACLIWRGRTAFKIIQDGLLSFQRPHECAFK